MVDGNAGKLTLARILKVFALVNNPKPNVTPISKPKEVVNELAENAIVINSYIDYPVVQKLHIRTGYPIFERASVKEKVAKG